MVDICRAMSAGCVLQQLQTEIASASFTVPGVCEFTGVMSSVVVIGYRVFETRLAQT